MNVAARRHVLTVNGGSSSIRCALYEIPENAGKQDEQLILQLRLKVDRIQQSQTQLQITQADGASTRHTIRAGNRNTVVAELLQWLEAQAFCSSITAIGHRVVHGLSHSAPQRVTAALLQELQNIVTLDPEHLPFELELINAFQRRFASVPQVACFDTAFHRSMPDVAKTLPIANRFQSQNIERFGFHGLSYAYLLEELRRVNPRLAAQSRVIMAHLGNGASIAAIHSGQCVDTTMSFTPVSGIMMSTRSGDIDPGLLFHLSKSANLSSLELQRLMNHESGMLGVSGISGDVRDLLQRESAEPRAALALNMFCYQIRKQIGAYAAALRGLDAVIFAGGIGENAAPIRQRICDGLQYMNIEVDAARNTANADVISPDSGGVTVYVMHTDEELMIARSVAKLLHDN